MLNGSSAHAAFENELVIKVDNIIERELVKLSDTCYEDFKCDGALLFLPDPYSKYLEPAFDSHSREYALRRAVSTSYGTLDAIRAKPHSAWNSGIATVAYQDGQAYSRDPEADVRFDAVASESRSGLGIAGSMMAVRLDDATGRALGVVVVYTKEPLPNRSEVEELQLLDLLRRDLTVLSNCLCQRRQLFSERDVSRYNTLAQAFVSDVRFVRSTKQVIDGFSEIMKQLLQADQLIVLTTSELRHEDEICPTLSNEQLVAIRNIDSILQAQTNADSSLHGIALNRPEQNPTIYDLGCTAFHESRIVWCRVAIDESEPRVTCFAARSPSSISHHWLPNDLTFLTYACRLLHEELAKCVEFDVFLSHLSRVNGGDGQAGQFEFLYRIVKNFFGVNQLLLADITRGQSQYTVSVRNQWATGFGDGDSWMCQHPKTLDPSHNFPEHPDIMVRILHDFLHGEGKPIYIGLVDGDNHGFSLDDDLNRNCHLKGNIYFLPCCLSGDKRVGKLKGILHLGRSDGKLEIPRQALPFLVNLGTHVASWLEREHQRDVTAEVSEIRDITKLNHPNLQDACVKVASATQCLGCTLFLNVRCLPLLDARFADQDSLTRLFGRFCRSADNWKSLFGADNHQKLCKMFAAFLGTSLKNTKLLLCSTDAAQLGTQLGRLVVDSVYVRVAQSNCESELEKFAYLVERHDELDTLAAAKQLGEFVLGNVYLSGFGLTGWVLRYCCPISLANKNRGTLEASFRRAEKRNAIVPPTINAILSFLSGHRTHRDRPITSNLEKTPIQSLRHADHISEDPCRCRPQDPFVAYPLDEIDDLGKPIGVLRISNTASLRQEFELLDQETVAATARHISHLVRQEFIYQESRLNAVLIRRGEEEHSTHFYERLYESVTHLFRLTEDLETVLQGHAVEVDPDVQSEFTGILSRLGELANTALGIPRQRVFAGRVLEREEAWTATTACETINKWLKCVGLSALVTCADDDIELPKLNTRKLLLLCQLTEEVVKNHRRYQHTDSIRVVLALKPELAVFVGSITVNESDVSHSIWTPYVELSTEGTKGGGMRLIEKCQHETAVQFAHVPSDGSDEMIARITSK